jgi:hypothetical protein
MNSGYTISSKYIPAGDILSRMTGSKRFYAKSLTLLPSILSLVEKDMTQAQIARDLKKSKQLVGYYLSKMEELGFIKRGVRDAFVPRELTAAGKRFLDQYQNNKEPPTLALENMSFIAEVYKIPEITVDWEKVQLNNWVQYHHRDKIDGVSIRVNCGKQPTVELFPTRVEGSDPFELFGIAQRACIAALVKLCESTGMVAGDLQPNSRPEFVVPSPIAKRFTQHLGQVTLEGIGKVNASLPNRDGEFEFHNPRDAVGFLALPRNVRELEQRVENLDQKIQILAQVNGSASHVPAHYVQGGAWEIHENYPPQFGHSTNPFISATKSIYADFEPY